MHQRQDDPSTGFGEPTSASVLTPQDIQQKEFRVSRFGGYKMADVDEFLDRLTESVGRLLSENERLRRQGPAPVVGEPDLADVSRQADEIIQRARDEAARLVAEARERTANAAGVAMSTAATDEDRVAVNAFLQQERAFLQSLGALVQSHAESMRGMARQARGPAGGPKRDDAAPPPPEPAAAPKPAVVDAKPEPVETKQQPDADAKPQSDTGAKPESDVDPKEQPDADATQAVPTQERASAVPIRVDQPEPAGARSREDADPSLRDLFWGEDA
jgi:DivIVA domain-containing protein